MQLLSKTVSQLFYYVQKLSARLSHRNSVCPSVRLYVCHTGGSVKNGAS